MHACIHTYIYPYKWHIQSYMFYGVYTYIYIHIYTCACVYMHTYTHLHIHVRSEVWRENYAGEREVGLIRFDTSVPAGLWFVKWTQPKGTPYTAHGWLSSHRFQSSWSPQPHQPPLHRRSRRCISPLKTMKQQGKLISCSTAGKRNSGHPTNPHVPQMQKPQILIKSSSQTPNPK